MKIKKLLACCLALIMTFSALALSGCNSSDKDSGKKTTSAATDKKENQNSKPSDEEDKKPDEESKNDVKPDEVTEFCFSRESGFYDNEFTLKIYHPNSEAKIYYTLDGYIPTASSTAYGDGIKLENRTSEKNNLSAEKGISAGGDYYVSDKVKKGNIVRALAVLPDGTEETICGTFFVGIDREKEYGDVPVISLITEKDNLFDYNSGIYVLGKTHDQWLAEDNSHKWLEAWQHQGNYSNRGREWERPVNVEYISADGNGFNQDMGIRIMGGASRNNNQKSLRLIARDDYGKKNVKYPVIPDNYKSDGNGTVEKYKSFVLRCGGNDADFAKIRDPILQELVSDRNFETMQYVPVVAFINGEYWGMYTLVEDYSDNYIQNNYDGIDNENVAVIKNGSVEEGLEEDKLLFDAMYDAVAKKDMSVEENYLAASRLLDMQSFADYCAFNLYIFNEDSFFKGNNWRMWRVREEVPEAVNGDGKWRMMVFDTDYSTGIYNDGDNYNHNNFSEAIVNGENGSFPADMFTSLLKNENFKGMFINALCDMRNINFERENVKSAIDEAEEIYESLVPDTFERFGPQWVADQHSVLDYYSDKIDKFEKFLLGRYTAIDGIIKRQFELEAASDVTIPQTDGGYVFLNAGGALDLSHEFSGKYFKEYPITVYAQAQEGKVFAGWEVIGGEISDADSPEAIVTITSDSCTVTPKFTASSDT